MAAIAGIFSDQIGISLEAAVATDVFDLHSVVGQHAPYEQVAVATGRILFTAQDSHSEFAETLLQAREAFLKKPGTGHTIIEHMSFAIVKFGALGPAAEFFPHMEIANVTGD